MLEGNGSFEYGERIGASRMEEPHTDSEDDIIGLGTVGGLMAQQRLSMQRQSLRVSQRVSILDHPDASTNAGTFFEVVTPRVTMNAAGTPLNSSLAEMKATLLEAILPAGGTGAAVLGVLTAAVTPAVLSLPIAFSYGGVQFAVACIIGCVLMTFASVRFLLLASFCADETEYQGVVYYHLGPQMESLVRAIILFYNFGCGVVNLRFIVENMEATLNAFGVPHYAWAPYIAMTSIVFVCLPLLFKSRISSLKTFGFLSNFAIIAIVGVVVLKYYKGVEAPDWSVTAFNTKDGSLLSQARPYVFVAPIFIFSYEVQSNFLSIIHDIEKPSYHQVVIIVLASLGLATAFYFTIGLYGSFTFGMNISGNVLNSYRQQDTLLNMCNLLCAFASVVTFLFVMFPCRYAVFTTVFGGRGRTPTLLRAQIATALAAAAIILAIFVPDVAVVVSLLGAVCSSSLSMTIPALLAFNMRRYSSYCTEWYDAAIASLLLVGGILTAIVGTWANLM